MAAESLMTSPAAEVEKRNFTVWQIDPAHTSAEFAVRHMMVSTVKGTFKAMSGSILFDEASPVNSQVEADIDATSLDTGVADRDAHLRSPDFLDVAAHPEITFTSKRIEKADGGYARGYMHAVDYWREIVNQLNILRSSRGMVVLLIAHAKIERFEDPEASAYDRYSPRLHKHAGALVTEGKADLVKAFQDATGVFDAAGICVFTSFAWTLADVQPQIQAACEGDWSMEKLNEVGERIWNMERQFNLAAGLTAKDDDLPPRLKTEPAKTGPAKGLVNGLDKMKPEYYKVRGWTPEGVPEKATLERLGL